MPVLVSETDVRLERNDLLKRVMLPRQLNPAGYIVPPARTPGLHLSGLIKYMARKVRISTYVHDAEEEAGIERGHMPLRWAVGQAMEEFLASLYPDMIWQPGEATEPIIGSCDGISYLEPYGVDLVVDEFKCSRAKKIRNILDRWAWLQQGLGYCVLYGAEYVRWHVLSLFEFPDPLYTQYLVRFSGKELDEMRRAIEINRAAAIEEGYAE